MGTSADRMSEQLRPASVSVVGARGFIGRNVVAELLARGHVVHEFEFDSPPMVAGTLDQRVLESDRVVWAAASINPLIAENDPDRVSIDLADFTAFIRAVQNAGGPSTILLSSGGTVYDTSRKPPYHEGSSIRPAGAYGRAKRRLETALLTNDAHGVVLRVSNAYGPGQPVAPGQGVIAHWLNAIATGAPLHVYGGPEVSRDYVHVTDIARAVAAVVERPDVSHEVLNVGAGVATTLGELLEEVIRVVGREPEVVHHPSRPFDVRHSWLDCRKAEEKLGWRATTTLAEGLAETWAAVSASDAKSPLSTAIAVEGQL